MEKVNLKEKEKQIYVSEGCSYAICINFKKAICWMILGTVKLTHSGQVICFTCILVKRFHCGSYGMSLKKWAEPCRVYAFFEPDRLCFKLQFIMI